MPLPVAAPERQLKHRRRIDVHVHARGDGLWEVDAELSDVKTADTTHAGGLKRAGEPIHDMLVRLVIDERFNILAAGSQPRAVPYPGHCDAPGDPYAQLVGLNLMQGFRAGVHERVGGVRGCTHITELALVLPTAVVQAFAGDVLDTRAGRGDAPPFQIDRCRALPSDGEAVRLHYPRWHRPMADAATPTETQTEGDR